MRLTLLAVLCFSQPILAAQSSQNAEAFQATKQYTQQLMGDKESLGGKVVETMEVASYTYVKFKTGDKNLWLATSKLDVKKGDLVSFEGGQLMHKFHSKSLNRTFDEIYFVNDVTVRR